jgi:iron complex outermembrane receptor protein|tara:strand:- start:5405 stop:5506 length:102 start_codon:yes stop_codon:yes gene_type:complete
VLRTDEEIFSPGSFDGVIREEGRTYLARVKYLF